MGKVSYEKSAKQILDAVGGQENVQNAAHCATRWQLFFLCTTYNARYASQFITY